MKKVILFLSVVLFSFTMFAGETEYEKDANSIKQGISANYGVNTQVECTNDVINIYVPLTSISKRLNVSDGLVRTMLEHTMQQVTTLAFDYLFENDPNTSSLPSYGYNHVIITVNDYDTGESYVVYNKVLQ